ncbi:PREDICTED: protein RETICULATA-RELATED 1, chloroplastic-like [Lupinus angustifolius]|uniref:protein RETICULATA-RELATED 1, chloroplastic-like n=1 Tax=Lupinus angustifolius TaxID=3871 RepID=UPI00092E5034|nr:PREDICTED: protein RETICULATA-RELATED 1, chloroplastic-like [Lupinus angustifolius]
MIVTGWAMSCVCLLSTWGFPARVRISQASFLFPLFDSHSLLSFTPYLIDGGGDGDEGGSEGDEELGPLLNFEAVMKEAEARGVKLPSDMVEAAKNIGIREMFLLRYLELEGSAWPLSFLMKHCSMLRNRMLADPSFLFKVGIEVVIDSCCATFAEVQKRGKDFWAEFELYAADLLVGVVVDIALVGILAPYARIGKPSVSKGLLGGIQHACAALPSSVFEAERPGCKFSTKQRIATYFYKGALYGSVGFGCGLIGQGIANMIMNAKRFLSCLIVEHSKHLLWQRRSHLLQWHSL